jgi:signal transduction histidine kinase
MSPPDSTSHPVRGWLVASPLHRLISAVAAAGLLAAAAVVVAADRWGSLPPAWTAASDTERVGLVVLFVVLACAAEVGYVRMRHGESTEDLTFFEAVLVAGVLVLPSRLTLAISLAGLALACLLMRRSPAKTLFNLGSYACATSALVAMMMLTPPQSPYSFASVLTLLVGTAAFASINLVALVLVLGASAGLDRRAVLAEQWRLSAFMMVSQVGLGTVTVAVAAHAPILLPFMALPVLAIAYAYRSAAHRAEETEKGRQLLALGAAVAGAQERDDFPLVVAGVVRRLFSCDALILDVPGHGVVEELAGPARARAADAGVIRRLAGASLHGATEPYVLEEHQRPAGWRYAIVAPVDTGDRGAGLLVLGWEKSGTRNGSRPWQRGADPVAVADQALLSAVAAAIGAAVRSRLHLVGLVEESAKLQTVVDHSSDGIVVVDETGGILVWSPAMQRLTGLTAEDVTVPSDEGLDVVATLLETVAAKAGGAPDVAALRQKLQPDLPHATVRLTLGDHEETARSLRISVSRTAAARVGSRLAIITVHDVTREWRAERLKSDFIATVSHELRTPITPIKAYARMLATKGADLDAQRRERALRVIEDRADHLARLIEDLLLASRVSSGGSAKFVVESAEHDLGDLVHRAVESFPQLADRMTVTAPQAALTVRADSMRVIQCVSNLVSNAEKYSAVGGTIAVDVRAPAHPADLVSVSVRDSGPGIAPTDLDQIFQRFYRVESPLTMRAGGSGLGLFIARELARAMGGDLTVASRVGHGSTFTLTLPSVQAGAAVDAA